MIADKNDIIIKLKEPDHEYISQGKISELLIEKGVLSRGEIVSVTPESVIVNSESLTELPELRELSNKIKTTLNQNRMKVGNTTVTGMFSEGGSGSGDGASSSSAPAGVGSSEGIGAANLRGTTLIGQQNKDDIVEVNVDDLLHDPESFSEGCPEVVFSADCCFVNMPDQTVYSIGQLPFNAVEELNNNFQEVYAEYAAEVDTKQNNVYVDTYKPKHVMSNKEFRTRGNNSHVEELARRSQNKAGADDVPVANLLVSELQAAIGKGVRMGMTGNKRITRPTKDHSPFVDNAQHLMSFAEEAYDSVFSASWSDKLVAKGVKKIAKNQVGKAKDKVIDKAVQVVTNKQY